MAYGIKQKLEGPADIGVGRQTGSHVRRERAGLRLPEDRPLPGPGVPAVPAACSRLAKPSIWPVDGALMRSSFGQRTDPFSGEGAFHTGVDISAPTGAPVHATAGRHRGVRRIGKAATAGWWCMDHGGGLQTYYAHLSQVQRAHRAGNPPRRRRWGAWAAPAAPPLRTCTTKCGWPAIRPIPTRISRTAQMYQKPQPAGGPAF